MAMPEIASDITVRGAGIFGLSIAWVLACRGAHVQVIDPHGAGSGSSGGLVGALAPHVPENWNDKKAFQLDSLLSAEAFWAEVQQAGGVDPGYARTGRLQPVADEHALDLAHARTRGAKALWHGRATLDVIRSEDAGEFAPQTPSGFLIHDTLTARMHPRQACAALVAALRAKGAEITTDGPDTGHVLHATGTMGLEDLTRHHTRTVGNGVKGQGALLDYAMPDAPQLFADTIHIVPHADGTTAIGSTSERDYDTPDTTDAQLDEVIARARRAVPALADAPVIERWAGVRPRSRTRAPMLGAHPLYPGHFIANGGFKIGFGMAPKVGQVMADLMLDGADNIPPDFRPEVSY